MAGLPGDASERLSKKVDESWKDAVSKERTEAPAEDTPQSPGLPPVDFLTHISGLAYQAMIWMGLVPHPADNKPVEPSLPQAQYFIDTIEMLVQKAQTGMTPEEKTEATALLYELRLRFVEKRAELRG